MRSSSCCFSIPDCKATDSINSMACVGRKWIVLTAFGWWPLRPARWINLPTPLGLPTWIQFSTGLKSTPKSKLEVQTTTFRVLLRSASSTQSLIFLSMLPWCIAIFPAKLGFDSNRAWNQSSHCARVFVNTKVLLCFSIKINTWGSRCKPKWPRQGKRSIVFGSTDFTLIFFEIFALITE